MKALLPLIFLICSVNVYANKADSYLSQLHKTEAEYNLPTGTMAAISKMESGNHPWTLNINGVPMYLNSQEQLISVLKNINTRPYYFRSKDGFFNFHNTYLGAYKAAHNLHEDPNSVVRLNIKSTDICGMQLNYKWQNDKFQDVIEMTNIPQCLEVSAQILTKLIKKHGYLTGIGCYHNCNISGDHHTKYIKRFLKTLKIVNPEQYRLVSK